MTDISTLVGLGAVAAIVIMFAVADRETRRAFCWIIIFFSIVAIASIIFDPSAWVGH